MMTIREYFDTMATEATTEEEYEAVRAEEEALYEAYEADEIDIEEWAIQHGVDLTAIGYEGISVFTSWCWDMCGE